MKRSPLIAAATLTLLMTSPAGAAESNTREEVLMPEVKVTGQAEDRQHPQDGVYSDRPLGCVEVVTPSGSGNTHGGYFFARFAPHGIPVIPSLKGPSSAHDTKPELTGKDHQGTPAGQAGKPGCQR